MYQGHTVGIDLDLDLSNFGNLLSRHGTILKKKLAIIII